jgi:hypothetical protein
MPVSGDGGDGVPSDEEHHRHGTDDEECAANGSDEGLSDDYPCDQPGDA